MNIGRVEWHAADRELAGYLGGASAPVVMASIEAHLLGCAHCRDRLGRLGEDAERTEAWDRLADAIDRPSPSLIGRLSGGHFLARSAVATPIMLRAAAVAVGLVALVPLAAAMMAGDAALVALLVLAPLAPVAAVAVAYRDRSDPAGEITLATPAAGLRLVAMRALVVSAAALPLVFAVLGAVEVWLIDVPIGMAAAWCLPGIALAALVLLAGTTRLDPLLVAIGLGAGWGVAVISTATVRRSLRPEIFIDIIASPALQASALLVAVTALLLTFARRDAVSYRRIA